MMASFFGVTTNWRIIYCLAFGVWCLAQPIFNFILMTATSLFFILTFLLFILFATKILRHKETRRLFYISEMKTSPFGGLRGLTNSRFFFTAENGVFWVYAEIIIHEKLIFSFPKYPFYILPRDFGADYSIFYILHSPNLLPDHKKA